MEFKPEDVEAFMSHQLIGTVDGSEKTFKGHIPADNSYGMKEMDVAILVSQPLTGNQDDDLRVQFNNELKLLSLKNPNIIDLIGFSEAKEKCYLVYEIFEATPLSKLIEGLTWGQARRILKGIAMGLSFLHNCREGPFVHSNICMGNILVTKDFVPKLIGFRYCVVAGQKFINPSTRYYPSKQEGVATVQADVYAFGLVALQLLTKDSRTIFAVEEGSDVACHHILDLYLPMYREKGNFVHPSYGQEKASRKWTEMVVKCLKKDSKFDLSMFLKDLNATSLIR